MGEFSPSLKTLRKLCAGLYIRMSTLFLGWEFGGRDDVELIDMVHSIPPELRGEVEQVLRHASEMVERRRLGEQLREDSSEPEK